MKINTRVSIMMLMIFFLGAMGYFGLTYMNKKMMALEDITGELEAVSSLNLSLHEAVSHLNNYAVTGDPDERERFKEASAGVKELFDKVAGFEGPANADVSLENARLLYKNIEKMAGVLFKNEVPLNNKGAVALMFEIQQTSDWISQLYIQVHELKDREKLEKVVKEAESGRRLAGWILAIGTISALIIVIIFCRR